MSSLAQRTIATIGSGVMAEAIMSNSVPACMPVTWNIGKVPSTVVSGVTSNQ